MLKKLVKKIKNSFYPINNRDVESKEIEIVDKDIKINDLSVIINNTNTEWNIKTSYNNLHEEEHFFSMNIRGKTKIERVIPKNDYLIELTKPIIVPQYEQIMVFVSVPSWIKISVEPSVFNSKYKDNNIPLLFLPTVKTGLAWNNKDTTKGNICYYHKTEPLYANSFYPNQITTPVLLKNPGRKNIVFNNIFIQYTEITDFDEKSTETISLTYSDIKQYV